MLDILKKRSELQERIVRSLNHLPRELAMHDILSWFSVEELECISPTLCGSEEPVTDPTQAFLHRLQMGCIPYDIRVSISSKKLTKDQLTEAWMKILRDALS